MSQAFWSQELLSLCADLVEGELDESRAARLGEILNMDPVARDFYLRFIEVHAFLHLDYSEGSTPAAMPGGSSMPLASLTEPALGDVFDVPSITNPTFGNPQPTLFSGRAVAVAFGFGMAAMLLLVGLVAAFVRWERSDVPANLRGAVRSHASNGGGSESAIARLVRLDDARWEPGESQPPKVGDLIKAGPFHLQAGGATLAFLNGVVLSLDGPADLDLVTADRVFCRRGRLQARVPKQVEGFVIASPKSGPSTIGTDFVLDVDHDGRVQIKVYEGITEAALLDANHDPERAQALTPFAAPNAAPKPKMTTGRGGSDAGGETRGPATTGVAYPLDLAAAYPALIKDSHPIGYWRFSALEGGSFTNEVAGAPALRLTGGARLEGNLRGNRYVVLPANHGEPFLETDPVWRLPQPSGHSVEFWFLAEARRHASLVGLLPARGLNPVGLQDHYLHSLLIEIIDGQSQRVHKASSVRLMLRSPNEPLQMDNVYSAQSYVPGRWHHVVAQTRGDAAELYLDGILAETSRFNPAKTPTLCQIVVGRRTPDPGDPNDSRAFVGSFDELALYDHPLSPAEIRKHLQALVAPNAGR